MELQTVIICSPLKPYTLILPQALSDLRAREASLTSVSETRESLYESQRGLEKTVEGLRNQLHEEITARKLAEQKNESLKGQLDDIKAKRVCIP